MEKEKPISPDFEVQFKQAELTPSLKKKDGKAQDSTTETKYKSNISQFSDLSFSSEEVKEKKFRWACMLCFKGKEIPAATLLNKFFLQGTIFFIQSFFLPILYFLLKRYLFKIKETEPKWYHYFEVIISLFSLTYACLAKSSLKKPKNLGSLKLKIFCKLFFCLVLVGFCVFHGYRSFRDGNDLVEGKVNENGSQIDKKLSILEYLSGAYYLVILIGYVGIFSNTRRVFQALKYIFKDKN